MEFMIVQDEWLTNREDNFIVEPVQQNVQDK